MEHINPLLMAIFFRGGYAIHGTNMVGRLGRVDSHGCIRLAPGNARVLFEMVALQRGATCIVVEGASPPSHRAGAGGPPRRPDPLATASAPARTAQMGLPAAGPAWVDRDNTVLRRRRSRQVTDPRRPRRRSRCGGCPDRRRRTARRQSLLHRMVPAAVGRPRAARCCGEAPPRAALQFVTAAFMQRLSWTGGRVVEGARLESVYTGNRIAGSNPALSARYSSISLKILDIF